MFANSPCSNLPSHGPFGWVTRKARSMVEAIDVLPRLKVAKCKAKAEAYASIPKTSRNVERLRGLLAGQSYATTNGRGDDLVDLARSNLWA